MIIPDMTEDEKRRRREDKERIYVSDNDNIHHSGTARNPVIIPDMTEDEKRRRRQDKERIYVSDNDNVYQPPADLVGENDENILEDYLAEDDIVEDTERYESDEQRLAREREEAERDNRFLDLSDEPSNQEAPIANNVVVKQQPQTQPLIPPQPQPLIPPQPQPLIQPQPQQQLAVYQPQQIPQQFPQQFSQFSQHQQFPQQFPQFSQHQQFPQFQYSQQFPQQQQLIQQPQQQQLIQQQPEQQLIQQQPEQPEQEIQPSIPTIIAHPAIPIASERPRGYIETGGKRQAIERKVELRRRQTERSKNDGKGREQLDTDIQPEVVEARLKTTKGRTKQPAYMSKTPPRPPKRMLIVKRKMTNEPQQKKAR